MIGVPALIGRAANKPTPLMGDLRFCHSRFRRCSLISSPHSFIDRINSETSHESYHFVLAVWRTNGAESGA
jgi:hypothetical protein